jgi:hypothetical protein
MILGTSARKPTSKPHDYRKCPAYGEITVIKKMLNNGITDKLTRTSETVAKMEPMVKTLWKLQWWQISIMVAMIGAALGIGLMIVRSVLSANAELISELNDAIRSIPK